MSESNEKVWFLGDSPFRFTVEPDPLLKNKEKRKFTAAIMRDIKALTEDLDGWIGGEELPTPERDLTSYAGAYESAREKCPHENTTELLWHREYKCEDCLTIVPYAKIKKRTGWFF